MLVEEYDYANGTTMIQLGQNYTMPDWMKEKDFTAMVKYYPAESWNNIRAYISAPTVHELQAFGLSYHEDNPFLKVRVLARACVYSCSKTNSCLWQIFQTG